MGASDRRKRERELLRERVLESAEEIIAREGAQQVTMRRIASSVDYTASLLYRLFASKNDLMDHLIARGYGGVRQRYEQVLNREDLEPLQTLACLLDAYTDYALSHPNHYRMWFETSEISLEQGELRMRHGHLEFVVFGAWLDCVDTCLQTGLFPDRDRFEVFHVLWSRVHGVISLRLQHPDFPWPPAETHLQQVLDLTRLAEGRGDQLKG